MSNPITQIPSEPAGNAKETAWFRQLLRCIRERTAKVGPGLRVSYKADGTLIELDAVTKQTSSPAAPSSPTVRMRIVTVDGDYFTARRQAEDATVDDTSELFYVAKPHFLRVTILNGLVIDGWTIGISSPGNTRTETAGVGSGVTAGLISNRRLNYPYAANDTIYATKPEGKTAVDHPTIGGQKIEWLDTNVDARNFHTMRIMLNACVSVGGIPTAKLIVFEAGPVP